jgi:hypothetical protein
MHVVFRPEAEEELLEAQAWYEARAAGLGLEFARAVDVAVEAASNASRSPQDRRRFSSRPLAAFSLFGVLSRGSRRIDRRVVLSSPEQAAFPLTGS